MKCVARKHSQRGATDELLHDLAVCAPVELPYEADVDTPTFLTIL